MIRIARTARCLLLMAVLAAPSGAQAAEADPDGRWSMALKSGVAHFLHSQSTALAHMLKPTARIEMYCRLKPRVQVGVELGGPLSSNENYLGMVGYVMGRGSLYRGEVYELTLGWGTGLGQRPRILSPDLIAEAKIGPRVQLALNHRWGVGGGMELGIDLVSEDLVVHSLMAALGRRF
jgi:hypothetical protein